MFTARQANSPVCLLVLIHFDGFMEATNSMICWTNFQDFFSPNSRYVIIDGRSDLILLIP